MIIIITIISVTIIMIMLKTIAIILKVRIIITINKYINNSNRTLKVISMSKITNSK